MRLHESLVRIGVDSRIATRDSHTDSSEVTSLVPSAPGRIKSFAVGRLNRIMSKNGVPAFFSPLELGFDIQHLVSIVQPDVLHLHNLYNLADLKSIAGENLPTVATLHDQRLFTGGCHYSGPCRGFTCDCQSCPQTYPLTHAIPVYSLRSHRASVWSIPKLAVVSPSRWLRSLAQESSVLSHSRVEYIRNCIDVHRFCEIGRQSASAPSPMKSIGWLPGKGHDLMLRVSDAIAQAAERNDQLFGGIVLHTTEKCPAEVRERWKAVRIFPGLDSEDDRAGFWGSCNVGLSTTSVDNFPNVVLECIAAGTPFVAPAVGGAAEFILDSGGGLATLRSPIALSDGVIKLLCDRNLASRMVADGQSFAFREIDQPVVAEKYSDIYWSLVNGSRG